MKTIQLTKGEQAFIDDEDSPQVNKYKWFCVFVRGRKYAARQERDKLIYLSRFLLNPGKGKKITYLNNNSLDYRRENLRIFNGKSTANYKGVYRTKSNRFTTSICYKGERKCLGTFDTEKEAVLAYNHMALEFFGENANLNIIKEQQHHGTTDQHSQNASRT